MTYWQSAAGPLLPGGLPEASSPGGREGHTLSPSSAQAASSRGQNSGAPPGPAGISVGCLISRRADPSAPGPGESTKPSTRNSGWNCSWPRALSERRRPVSTHGRETFPRSVTHSGRCPEKQGGGEAPAGPPLSAPPAPGFELRGSCWVEGGRAEPRALSTWRLQALVVSTPPPPRRPGSALSGHPEASSALRPV